MGVQSFVNAVFSRIDILDIFRILNADRCPLAHGGGPTLHGGGILQFQKPGRRHAACASVVPPKRSPCTYFQIRLHYTAPVAVVEFYSFNEHFTGDHLWIVGVVELGFQLTHSTFEVQCILNVFKGTTCPLWILGYVHIGHDTPFFVLC